MTEQQQRGGGGEGISKHPYLRKFYYEVRKERRLLKETTSQERGSNRKEACYPTASLRQRAMQKRTAAGDKEASRGLQRRKTNQGRSRNHGSLKQKFDLKPRGGATKEEKRK